MITDKFKFYDQGWNAYVNGEPFEPNNATIDWRDGWLDAEDANATEEFPEAEEESK